jgi:hypothetical protein
MKVRQCALVSTKKLELSPAHSKLPYKNNIQADPFGDSGILSVHLS